MFFHYFYKGKCFDFLFASLEDIAIPSKLGSAQKGSSNSFLSELISTEKGGRNDKCKFSCLQSVPIHLRSGLN